MSFATNNQRLTICIITDFKQPPSTFVACRNQVTGVMCKGNRVYCIGMTTENAVTYVCNNLIIFCNLYKAKTIFS